MNKLTPIIMESEIGVVRDKLAKIAANREGRVHIDFGDGLFSELLTIAPADLQQFELAKLEMDFHLLVDDPTEWVEECVALNPKRLIGQIERMGSPRAFVEIVHEYGIRAGVGLKITTPISAVERQVLKKVEVILLLAVPAGTSGSKFDERVIGKIHELRKIYNGDILIDGGIDRDTYARVVAAGASEAGANSAYWRGEFG